MRIWKHFIVVTVIVYVWAITACGSDDDLDDDNRDDTPSGQPILTGTVAITGTPRVGETLYADISKLGGTGDEIYLWECGNQKMDFIYDSNLRDRRDHLMSDGDPDFNICPFPLTSDFIGYFLRVTVQRHDYDGKVISNTIGPVLNANGDPLLTGTVTITGTPRKFEILCADISQLDGEGKAAYLWDLKFENGIIENSGDDRPFNYEAASIMTSSVYGNYFQRVTVQRDGYSGKVTSDWFGPIEECPITGTVSITIDNGSGPETRAPKAGDNLCPDISDTNLHGDTGAKYLWQYKRHASDDWIDLDEKEWFMWVGYTLDSDSKGCYYRVIVKHSAYVGEVISNRVGPILDENGNLPPGADGFYSMPPSVVTTFSIIGNYDINSLSSASSVLWYRIMFNVSAAAIIKIYDRDYPSDNYTANITASLYKSDGTFVGNGKAIPYAFAQGVDYYLRVAVLNQSDDNTGSYMVAMDVYH